MSLITRYAIDPFADTNGAEGRLLSGVKVTSELTARATGYEASNVCKRDWGVTGLKRATFIGVFGRSGEI
jgi:hypothetical protein